MAEYIDREALIKTTLETPFTMSMCLTVEECNGMNRARKIYARIFETLPAADVVPVRRGRWIWNDDGMDWGIGSWLCSACYARPETWWQGWESINPYRFSGSHYCPNCGAKMEVEE